MRLTSALLGGLLARIVASSLTETASEGKSDTITTTPTVTEAETVTVTDLSRAPLDPLHRRKNHSCTKRSLIRPKSPTGSISIGDTCFTSACSCIGFGVTTVTAPAEPITLTLTETRCGPSVPSYDAHESRSTVNVVSIPESWASLSPAFHVSTVTVTETATEATAAHTITETVTEVIMKATTDRSVLPETATVTNTATETTTHTYTHTETETNTATKTETAVVTTTGTVTKTESHTPSTTADPSASPSIIINGGFEYADPLHGWQNSTLGTGAKSATAPANSGSGGGRALRISTSSTASMAIHQVLDCVPGDLYRLTFDASKSPGTSSSASISVRLGGVTIPKTETSIAVGSPFTYFSYIFTCGTTRDSRRLELIVGTTGNRQADFYFDNFYALPLSIF